MGGAYNKDYGILGCILGSPYLGKLPYASQTEGQSRETIFEHLHDRDDVGISKDGRASHYIPRNTIALEINTHKRGVLIRSCNPTPSGNLTGSRPSPHCCPMWR